MKLNKYFRNILEINDKKISNNINCNRFQFFVGTADAAVILNLLLATLQTLHWILCGKVFHDNDSLYFFLLASFQNAVPILIISKYPLWMLWLDFGGIQIFAPHVRECTLTAKYNFPQACTFTSHLMSAPMAVRNSCLSYLTVNDELLVF